MSNKAFTLIELLVVTGIIALLTSLTLANYRFGDRQLALQRSANKLAQDLRRAQELAISAKEFTGVTPGGYGIYFDLDDAKHYILFADLNSDEQYSGSSEKVEEVTLEGTVKIIGLEPKSVVSSLTVLFIPPDPRIVFDPDSALSIITVGITEPALSEKVWINKVGLIAVAEELGDQCNSSVDCSDGNACTNDWCERPGDSDSVCHNDSLPNGTDCGDCRECQSGACTYLCSGTESSCCANDLCRDCSNYYGTDCDYGTCASNQKPSWSCSGGSCQYSCNNDPTCGCKINGTTCSLASECCFGYCIDGVCCNTACTGSTCQRCDSYSNAGAGTCGYVSTAVDPDGECGTTGCYTGNCNASGYACGYYSDNAEHNCTTACTTCNGAISGSCVNMANDTQDTQGSYTCSATCKKCSSGSCTNQSSSQDLFSQCTAGSCSQKRLNAATGTTCTQLCAGYTRESDLCSGGPACGTLACACASVGLDANATDGCIWQYLDACYNTPCYYGCATSLNATGMFCGAYQANWTYCACVN